MDATPIIIKKKKSHGHAHHGGSWKVAYADFVTAMMAFFMVMWIMGLSDDTRTKIQGYFNDPIGFTKNQPRSKSVLPIKSNPGKAVGSGQKGQTEANQPFKDDQGAMKALEKDIKEALASSPDLAKFLEHIKIQITEEGLRIEFLEDKSDFFESGKAELKPGALKVIKALAGKLAASGRQMGIEGHTDSVPFAGDAYKNFELSSDRANALGKALSESGVPVVKFQYIKGLADKELRDAAHPTSSVNRRVTILIPYMAARSASIPMPKDEVRHTIHGADIQKSGIIPDPPQILPSKN